MLSRPSSRLQTLFKTHTHIHIYIYTRVVCVCVCVFPLFTYSYLHWNVYRKRPSKDCLHWSKKVANLLKDIQMWTVYRMAFLQTHWDLIFLFINTQRTSEIAMQHTVLTKLIICGRVLLEKLIALQGIKKLQYHSHNSPPPVSIQRQFNPMYILHPHFLKFIFYMYIVASPTSKSSQRYRCCWYSYQNLACIFVPKEFQMVRPRNIFGFIALTTFDDEYSW
jgi:hypothetical protein